MKEKEREKERERERERERNYVKIFEMLCAISVRGPYLI